MGASLSFDFSYADVAYSNLGGAGPDDAWAPTQAIRYVNVGKVFSPDGDVLRFDLEVTNRSAYAPFNASLNVITGRFAQINLHANTRVDLRVTVKRSCSTADSCNVCAVLPTFSDRVHCYSLGCSCVGVTVYDGDDGGDGEHTQAYYVIKAAQEREELQRQGDELDQQIQKAEREIRALEKTLQHLF